MQAVRFSLIILITAYACNEKAIEGEHVSVIVVLIKSQTSMLGFIICTFDNKIYHREIM